MVQCRVKLDSAFRFTTTNDELKSTSYFTMFYVVCFFFLIFLSSNGGFRIKN